MKRTFSSQSLPLWLFLICLFCLGNVSRAAVGATPPKMVSSGVGTKPLARPVLAGSQGPVIGSTRAHTKAISPSCTTPGQPTITAGGPTTLCTGGSVTLSAVPAGPLVSTLAGVAGGFGGFADGPGSTAQFKSPNGIAVDAAGNVYVADKDNHRIRKIDPTGLVSTLAGSSQGYADGQGANAKFSEPIDVAVDAAGNVYVADKGNGRVRIITPSGLVSTLAGGAVGGTQDGQGAVAAFIFMTGIAVDATGNVYVVDAAIMRIRKITPGGFVSTLAGSTSGFADGQGSAARFNAPSGAAVDAAGNVYVGDIGNNRIRKITSSGLVSTLAGSTMGYTDGQGSAAQFAQPYGVDVDAAGNVYVADHANALIRKITPTGHVSTLAGSTYGYADGPAANAMFDSPWDVAVDAVGKVYVADVGNYNIRTITPPVAITGYFWSNGETTASISANTAGSYTVQTISDGCTSAISDPIVVTLTTPPSTPSITPSGPTTFCAGGSVTLSAPAGYEYLWSTNETTESINVTAAGSYTIRTIDAGCTSAVSALIVVTVNGPNTPTITPSGPTTFCSGGSVTLTAPTGFEYLWSTNETTESINVTAGGSYTVQTIASGCTSAASAPLVVTLSSPSAPAITASGPTTFCSGGSVTLTAPDGFEYLWSTNETSQSINVTAGGSYSVQTILYGCTSAVSAPMEVIVNNTPSRPTIKVFGSTTFCAGGSVTLILTDPNGSVLWSTGATSLGIQVTTSGSYTVRLINNGCTSAVSVPVAVTVRNPPSTPTISANGPTTFCRGNSVTLTAPSGLSYFWSNAATTRSITVTNSGSYTVRTISGGCTSAVSSAVQVTVNNMPAQGAARANTPTEICQGGSVELQAGPWQQRIWSTGETTEIITVYTSGSYTVRNISDGCTSDVSEPVVVTVGNTPSKPTITASGPTTFCLGGSVTLTAPAGFEYLWSNGETTQTTTIGFGETLTVQTISSGCTSVASDPVVVTVGLGNNFYPTISANGSSTICAGGSVTLSTSAPVGSSYLWSNNETTETINVTTAGLYTVQTILDGCTSIASVPVAVTIGTPPSDPTITASGPTTFCSGGSVTLSAPAGYEYLWSTNETTESINVTAAGSYTVQVISNGCTSAVSAPIVVSISGGPSMPTVTAGGPTTFCAGGAVVLTAPEGFEYLWSNFATTQSINVSTGGSYSVLTIASGCTSAASAPVEVTVNATPPKATLQALGSTTLCTGGSVTLQAPAFQQYIWSTNETSEFITVSTAGSYTVRTISNGCTSASSDPIVVTLGRSPNTPTITASGSTTFCTGGSVNLSIVPASATVSTLAGSSSGFANGQGANAMFSMLGGVAIDAAGNVYVADYDNDRIRKIDPSGLVSTFAGSSAGYADGQGTNAMFAGPTGVAVDAAGNVYVADFGNNRIRKIDPTGLVSTIAGSSTVGNVDGQGANASFNYPNRVAVDAAGNLYVADYYNDLIRKISPTGLVSTLAGSSQGNADGQGPAAQFNGPSGIAVDAGGNVYVTENGNDRIRKISPTGLVSTLAGSSSGYADGQGFAANFNNPTDVAVDAAGNVYVADQLNHRIRKIDPSGLVSTLAGSSPGFVDGQGAAARFSYPSGVALDAAGNVYIGDRNNYRVRIITQPAVITGYIWSNGETTPSLNATSSGSYTVQTISNGCASVASAPIVVTVGTPLSDPTITASGSTTLCSSGGSVTLSAPAGFSYLWSNNATTQSIIVSSVGSYTVQTISSGCTSAVSAATVITIASPPIITASGPTTFCPGGSVTLSAPAGFSYLWSNNETTQSINVTIAGGYTVRTIASGCTSAASAVTVVVLSSSPSTPTITAGGPTTFCTGGSVTLSVATQNAMVSTLAGSSAGFANGQGTNAMFDAPRGVALDAAGNVYVADALNHLIRKIDPTGLVSTFAGSTQGSADGQGITAQFNSPRGVVVDAAGNVYVADESNNRIRKIDPTGLVSTLAGSSSGFANGQGVAAKFNAPNALAVDAAGNVYVADALNYRIRKIDPTGLVSTLAGSSYGYADGQGTAANFRRPTGIALDAAGNVYVADSDNQRIRKITPSGLVSTYAGTTQGSVDGPVVFASFNLPSGVAVDAAGNVYVTDFSNHRIRKVTTAGVVSTLAGSSQGNADGLASTALFNNPLSLAVGPDGRIYVADRGNHQIRILTQPVAITGYLWNNGATTASRTISVSGSYTVRTIASGCTSATSDPIVVTVNSLPSRPNITAGGPTTFCIGGSVTLSAPSGFSYLWSNNETTQSINVTTAGSYTVRTIANGCTSSISTATSVTVNTLPSTPTITASGPTTFCPGGSVTLSAPSGFSYLWSNNETTQSINVTTAGSYTVQTIANGCTSSISTATAVTVNTPPSTPTVTPGGPTTFCSGGSVTLSAPAGFSYLWSNNATTQSINVTAAGSYTVQTIASSCTSAVSAATIVTVNTPPSTPSITAGGPNTFCTGGSVTLSAPAGFAYLWSNNATTQSINVTAGGSYTVQTIASGCTSSISTPTVVTVNTSPSTPTITAGGPMTFCNGGSVTLSAPAGFSYLWSNNATTQSINVTAAGSYTVQTVASGCTSSISTATVVTVNTSPSTPIVTAGGPTTFCTGGSVALSVAPEDAIVSTFAGSFFGSTDGQGTAARFYQPNATAIDNAGNIYVADSRNNLIRKITPGGLVSTFAGSSSGFADGQGTAAQFSGPSGVAVDAAGNIYVADRTNRRIRKISPEGLVSTLAGSSTDGSADGQGDLASFSLPSGIALDAIGNIYVADQNNHRIRKITPGGLVSTLAGSTAGFADGQGSAAQFSAPRAVAVDAAGNVYVGDVSNHRIRKITPSGLVSTLAGSTGGYADGQGSAAQFLFPNGVAVDAAGNVYVADLVNNRIRKVSPTGLVSTLAGSTQGSADGVGSQAKFSNPSGVTLDAVGNLYVADFDNNRIRKITMPASPSGYLWSDGATTASLNATTGGSYTVRTVSNGCTSATSAPVVVTVNAVSTPSITAGGPTTFCTGGSVTLSAPAGFGYLWSNNATTQSINVTAAGSYTVQTIASSCTSAVSAATIVTVNPLPSTPSITAGGPTSFCTGGSVTLSAPAGFAYLWSNNETTQSINVTASGSYTVRTIANGCTSSISTATAVTLNTPPSTPSITAGGPTSFCTGGSVTLTAPAGFAYLWSNNATTQSINVTAAGSYTVQTIASGCTSAVSAATVVTVNTPPSTPSITAGGSTTFCTGGSVTLTAPASTSAATVSTFAGLSQGFADGQGTDARFNRPFGIARDAAGNFYVADQQNHRIRKIAPSGLVSTFAGSTQGSADGQGTAAQFNTPAAVAIDAAGNVYVTDLVNHRIRKIDPSGLVSTLAGSTLGYTDGQGTAAQFAYPGGIAVDASGNVYVADQNNHRIRKIAPSGLVSTLAGSIVDYADGQGVAARFNNPTGVAVDAAGNVYVADQGNHRIRKVTPSGLVSTLAGSIRGYADAQGTSAQFNFTTSIAIDASGNIYVTDQGNHLIRKIAPTGLVSTLAGSTQGYAEGQGTAARFNNPTGVAVDDAGNVYVADWLNHRIRTITLPEAITGYFWSNGATTASITASTSGNYTVQTIASGCTSAASAATVVTVNTPPSTPSITAGGPTSFCTGGSVTLTAPAGFAYLWSNNETTQSINVTAAGSYTVQTIASGCTSAVSAATVVTVNTPPSTPTINAGGPTSFCTGGSVTLSAPAGFAYLWSNNETTQSINVTAAGSYTVQTIANGCTSAVSAAVDVTLTAPLSAPNAFVLGSSLICSGNGVTLVAIGNEGNIVWSNGDDGSVIYVTTPGTYYARTIKDGCLSANSVPLIVGVGTVPSTPTITAIGSTALCLGDLVRLSAPAGFNYIWSNNQTTQSIFVSASGSYTVQTISNTCTSAASAPIEVTVGTQPTDPTVTASGPTSFCTGGSVTLSAPAGYQYLWSTNETSQSINVTAGGSYSVQVINNGCRSAFSAPVVVSVGTPPSEPIVTASGPTSFCTGGSVNLSAPAGFSYLWSNNETSQSINVLTTGVYSVQTILNGCTSQVSEVIFVNVTAAPATPIISEQGLTTFCAGGGVLLSASNGIDYIWSTNETTDMIYVTTSGSYTVRAIVGGCTSAVSAPMVVTVNTPPSMPTVTAGGPTTFCSGGSVTLSAPAGFSYIWSNNATTQSINVTAGGSFTVQTISNGCTSAASAAIVVTLTSPPSTPTITTGGSTTFCTGGSVTLSAPAGFSYLWSNSATTQSINVSAAGTYTVQTINNGCTSAASAAIVVTISSPPSQPIVTASGPTTICGSGSVTLTAPIQLNMSTLAGSTQGYADGPGAAALFSGPNALVLDANGNTFVVDGANHRIRKITPAGEVSTFAGSTAGFANGTGVAAKFDTPRGIAIDVNGNLYVADSRNARIRMITPAGVVSTIAGAGPGFGDGSTSVARFSNPTGLAVNTNGDIYVADVFNHKIRKISGGVVTTFVGNTLGSADGAGGGARFNNPAGVALDGNGNLYVADRGNHSIRKVTLAGGVVTTVAGGTLGDVDGTGTSAQLNGPYSIAVGNDGNIYVADQVNNKIRKMTPAGVVTTVAGTSLGFADGGVDVAKMNAPAGVALDANGVVYVADISNNRIRKIQQANYLWSTNETTQSITVNTSGSYTVQTISNGCSSTASAPVTVTISTPPSAPTISAGGPTTFCAGGSVTLSAPAGFSYLWSNNATTQSINVPAGGSYTVQTISNSCTSAASTPVVVTISSPPTTPIVAAGGSTSFCAGGSVTLSVAPESAMVTTVAGSSQGFQNGQGTAAQFNQPNGLALDRTGNLYVADRQNHLIRKISPSGIVSVFAGSTEGYADGQGAAAQFNVPQGVAIDGDGNVYVADMFNRRIRKITPGGLVSTLAGSTYGYVDGQGSQAAFALPTSIAIDLDGNLYVTDANNQLIRKVTPGGLVSTFAGSTEGYADGQGTAAKFRYPYGIAVDANGNVYVGDRDNALIRKITPSGLVSTFAGSTDGYADGQGTQASFSFMHGLAVDPAGNIYVADMGNNKIRKITSTGLVSTLAGTTYGYADGNGNQAAFTFPNGVASDADGNIYVGDTYNHLIRKITQPGTPPTGYLWSNGATTASITAITSGSYTVRTISNGCTSAVSAATVVSVNVAPSKPAISASGSPILNPGGSVVLTAPAGFTYLWSNNETTRSITVSTAGTYSVRTILNGCTSEISDPVVVSIQVYPFIYSGTGVWTNTSNWSGGQLPSATDSAVVAVGANVTVDGLQVVKSLKVMSGATIRVLSDPTVNQLTVREIFDCDGSFNQTSGLVVGGGARNPAIIKGNPQTISNLRLVQNTKALAAFTIIDLLDIDQYQLDANSLAITLKSTVSKTASLVASGAGAIVNGNNFKVERWIDATKMSDPTGGWCFVAAPVQNQTVNVLAQRSNTFASGTFNQSSATGGSVYFYTNRSINGRPDANGFIKPMSANSNLSLGDGVRVWVRKPVILAAPLVFQGTPQTGTFTFSNLSFCSGSCTWTPLQNGWNLVGNPFAAELDWDNTTTGAWTKTGLSNEIHTWTNRPTGAVYASYVNGVGVNGGRSAIASGQSFFVVANQAAPTMTVSQLAIKRDGVNTFLRSGVSSDPLVRIKLMTGTTERDEVALRLNPDATAGYDATSDAGKLQSGGPSLALVAADGKALAIDARPEVADQIIPIDLAKLVGLGTPNLQFTGINSLGQGQLLLEHPSLPNAILISEGMTFDLSDTTYHRGLQLRHRGAITGIGQALTSSMKLYPNPSNGQVTVTGLPAMTAVRVSNALGQTLMTATMPANSTDLSLDLSRLPNGVYLVQAPGFGVTKLVKE